MKKILIIDDDKATSDTLNLFFSELNYKTIIANEGEQGLEAFYQKHPDLIISDLKMPVLSGLDILKHVHAIDPNIPVIIITAFDDLSSTIEAMHLGAYDYIEKPLDINRLKFIVQRALKTSELSKRLEIVVSQTEREYHLNNIVLGKSQFMREIIKNVGKLASNKVNILIEGESGTGKELISKIIHYSGITKNCPFIAVNSAAIPENLLESELFGHVKGAFTGAIRDKKGKFELAGGGTIFLDEITEISTHLQAKLLRVIQEREFEKVGAESSIQMNARIIAATNKNLEKMIREGLFREDLFYRLSVFKISVPPLRERKEDIPDYVVYFLSKINKQLHKNVTKIPYEVIEYLQDYDWVGNVRELENILLQAVVLSKGEVLEKENILLKKDHMQLTHYNNDIELSLAEMEKLHIKKTLDKVGWDKNEAARILKITRQTLYNKIKKYLILHP
jgi:two-component system response regulator AtoC